MHWLSEEVCPSESQVPQDPTPSRAHLINIHPLDLRAHQEFPSTRALEISRKWIARGQAYPYMICICLTLASTYKCSFSHSSLQAARTDIELREITTSNPHVRKQKTRVRVFQTPAQPRREIYGLLVAQPWEMCSGPTSYSKHAP
jgi:hypothetical protein